MECSLTYTSNPFRTATIQKGFARTKLNHCFNSPKLFSTFTKINTMNLIERLQDLAGKVSGWFSKVPTEIKRYAHEAHKITDGLKKGLDGNVADLVVTLIPGTWDNQLRDAAVLLLTEFGAMMQRIEGDSEEAVKAAKNALLAKTASKLIALQDKNELHERNYDLYQAISYNAEVKKSA